VAIIADEQGNKSSLMECPHFEVYEMQQVDRITSIFGMR
jgi:hypothetical protein